VLRGSAPAERQLGTEDETPAMPFEQRRVGVPT
jgi:hypothetical protein